MKNTINFLSHYVCERLVPKESRSLYHGIPGQGSTNIISLVIEEACVHVIFKNQVNDFLN